MAISPLPEPDKSGFINTLRGAAESLWGNIKRTISTPFGQKTVSPLAGPDVTQTGPGTFRSVWDSPRPSASPVSVPTPPPASPVASPAPTPNPLGVSQGQFGRRSNFDWGGASRANSASVNAITQAAQKYSVPSNLLFDIAASESSLSPTPPPNQESTAGGLFQFLDGSWKQVMREMGLPENMPKTDPYVNALAAAYAISRGRLSWWNASRGAWGSFYGEEELAPYYGQPLAGR